MVNAVPPGKVAVADSFRNGRPFDLENLGGENKKTFPLFAVGKDAVFHDITLNGPQSHNPLAPKRDMGIYVDALGLLNGAPDKRRRQSSGPVV